jgi:hypothetical protein
MVLVLTPLPVIVAGEAESVMRLTGAGGVEVWTRVTVSDWSVSVSIPLIVQEPGVVDEV